MSRRFSGLIRRTVDGTGQTFFGFGESAFRIGFVFFKFFFEFFLFAVAGWEFGRFGGSGFDGAGFDFCSGRASSD
jgi:hypothetical protein